jgi:hypothetical protein
VIPPVRDFYFTPQRASFLGVHALAGILGRSGVDCRIFDGTGARGRAAVLPGEFSYLAPYLGGEGFFKRYYRFGMMPDRLAGEIASWGPDHVLVSSFAFCYAAEALETAAACRGRMPHAVITAGGAGVTAYPEYYLRDSAVDYAVAGEADGVIADFLREPLSVPGVHYLKEGKMGDTGSPVPPDDFAPVLRRIKVSHNVAYHAAMFTRGCPMKCAFCSSRLHMPTFRMAGLDRVGEMFNDLRDAGGRVHLNIEDDTIASDFSCLLSVLELFRSSAGSDATFSMENGVDFRTLDAGKVRTLAGMGLRQLNISLVSTNAEVLSHYGRSAMMERFEEVVRAAAESGIPVTVYIIAGLKGETAESVRDGLRYLAGLPVLIGISPFYPVPGILGFEDRGIFDRIPPRLCAGTAFYPWHDCSTGDLVSLFREARSINLGKGRVIAAGT